MRKKETGGYRSAALFLRRAEESKQVNRGSFFLGKSEGPPKLERRPKGREPRSAFNTKAAAEEKRRAGKRSVAPDNQPLTALA